MGKTKIEDPPASVLLSARIPPGVMVWLEGRAALEDRTVSKIVARILSAAMAEDTKG